MEHVTQSPIPFTKEYAMKCKCPVCPIHKQSQCVKDMVAKLQENMDEVMAKVPMQKDEMPGVYCASGKAHCDDLNFRNPCVCGTCDIFNDDFHLADNQPAGYFCKGGAAR